MQGGDDILSQQQVSIQSKYDGKCKLGCGQKWTPGATLYGIPTGGKKADGKDELRWCSNPQCSPANSQVAQQYQPPQQPQPQPQQQQIPELTPDMKQPIEDYALQILQINNVVSQVYGKYGITNGAQIGQGTALIWEHIKKKQSAALGRQI